ncbi:MAG TPA: hypothetical protein VGC94_10135 [Amnibacterium sp.]
MPRNPPTPPPQTAYPVSTHSGSTTAAANCHTNAARRTPAVGMRALMGEA